MCPNFPGRINSGTELKNLDWEVVLSFEAHHHTTTAVQRINDIMCRRKSMKKLMVVVALLLLATSAFAQASPGRFAGVAGAGTTLNDDSCDIGVTPAATLLLPYFEVDFQAPKGEGVTTHFTITNTSNRPQIAHVTIWSDWSVPVVDFNIFLTGYDVQGIDLWDVIARGEVPRTGIGTSPARQHNHPNSPQGEFSANNWTGNPAFLASATADCNPAISGPIPGALLTAIQAGLTGGVYGFLGAGCTVGSVRPTAVGYVTVDVARTCSIKLPTDPSYYTDDIAFDNVLIGDTFRIDPRAVAGNLAGGTPMVHIRAIPGGTVDAAGVDILVPEGDITFPYTFYRRYTTLVGGVPTKVDRRQPLPGLFAARFVSLPQVDTNLAIWREGQTRAPNCLTPAQSANSRLRNAAIPLTELVRFDEFENANTFVDRLCEFSPCLPGQEVSFPETGAYDVDDSNFFPPYSAPPHRALDPANPNRSGWMFLNLHHSSLGTNGSQNWVQVQITAEGRFAVDFDAAWLANGCTPNPGESHVSDLNSNYILGPVQNNPFSDAPFNPDPPTTF
jgi:hypothetical protein